MGFLGRIKDSLSRTKAQIVLVTRYNTEIRWGRAWASTDAFIEVRPEYKMERLRRIVAEYGRVDAKERWIDIRFDKIGCPNPAGMAARLPRAVVAHR